MDLSSGYASSAADANATQTRLYFS